MKTGKTKIAVLDDYLNVVKDCGDWASLDADCETTFSAKT